MISLQSMVQFAIETQLGANAHRTLEDVCEEMAQRGRTVDANAVRAVVTRVDPDLMRQSVARAGSVLIARIGQQDLVLLFKGLGVGSRLLDRFRSRWTVRPATPTSEAP